MIKSKSTGSKRLLRLIAALAALAMFASACGGSGDDESANASSCGIDEVDGDLALFNWAEYIDEEQLAEFASTFGINATMTTYDSNEATRTQSRTPRTSPTNSAGSTTTQPPPTRCPTSGAQPASA